MLLVNTTVPSGPAAATHGTHASPQDLNDPHPHLTTQPQRENLTDLFRVGLVGASLSRVGVAVLQ